MSKTQQNLKFLIAFLATAGGMLIAVPVLIFAGPLVEPHAFAVLTAVRVQSAERDGTAVIFEVVGDKSRSCTYIGASALAGPRAGYMEPARLTFPEGLGQSRPTGEQSFGPWRVDPVATGELVAIQLRHHCHSLWETTTQLGPWRVAGSLKTFEGKKP